MDSSCKHSAGVRYWQENKYTAVYIPPPDADFSIATTTVVVGVYEGEVG